MGCHYPSIALILFIFHTFISIYCKRNAMHIVLKPIIGLAYLSELNCCVLFGTVIGCHHFIILHILPTLSFSSFFTQKKYTNAHTCSIKTSKCPHILQWTDNSCILYWHNVIGCHCFTTTLMCSYFVYLLSLFTPKFVVGHIVSKWKISATYFNKSTTSVYCIYQYYGVLQQITASYTSVNSQLLLVQIFSTDH